MEQDKKEEQIFINKEPVTQERFQEIKEDKSKRLIEDTEPNSYRVLERMTE